MQHDRDMAWEAGVLQRIIVLLLGLADLADQLRGAPRPLRRSILWILRAAESVAQTIVSRHAPLNPACVLALVRPGPDGESDAAQFAQRFRALAAALAAPLAQVCAVWRARGVWRDRQQAVPTGQRTLVSDLPHCALADGEAYPPEFRDSS